MTNAATPASNPAAAPASSPSPAPAAADRYEILTRTGPGTPMGELMRQYWIPAALASELAADGAPLRLKLLGEKLIAFRDSSGRVGVMDHRCPHRGASLFFGRNEEDGLRCVYHGWKYDVTGQCVDMANIPADRAFKDKIHTKAYIAAERRGLIWVYMGDPARVPELPPFEACLLPEEQIEYRFTMRNSNWLQALEGDLDTSHLSFLHFGGGQKKDDATGHRRNLVAHKAPEYKIDDAPFGLSYGAYRPAEGGDTNWRIAHYLFPFWAMPPISAIEKNVLVRGWIPLDDEHCMFVGIADKDYLGDQMSGRALPTGASLVEHLHPNTTDWLGRYRMVEAEENDYFINREVQKYLSYTGIDGIHVQDQAIVESMGPIVDHGFETLAPSDIAIVRVRRMMLAALREMAQGQPAPASGDPEAVRGVRGGHYNSADERPWQETSRDRIAASPSIKTT